MLILEDSRQQEKKHEAKHEYFRSVGCHWNRTALYCGDYTLPADQSVCIDTKKDIQELIGDIQVKQMSKGNILNQIHYICEIGNIPTKVEDMLFHAICDDDDTRFAEKEISDICHSNGINGYIATCKIMKKKERRIFAYLKHFQTVIQFLLRKSKFFRNIHYTIAGNSMWHHQKVHTKMNFKNFM